ncbi:MAG: hypothetical protein ACKOE5_02055 [Cytophagales bacterium]
MKWLISISLSIIVVLGGVYCSIYEGIYLRYYQEETADVVSIVLLSLPLVWFVITELTDKYNYSLRSEKFHHALLNSGKNFFGGLFIVFLLFRAVSGLIVMTNTVVPIWQSDVVIEGKVVYIFKSGFRRIDNFEVHVQAEKRVLKFDTNKEEANRFQVGDSFQLKMKKVFWGLIYLLQ